MWLSRLTVVLCLAGLAPWLAAAPALAKAKPAPAATAAPGSPMEQPMRVVVVHDGRPGCEPHCADWISAEGKIVRTTTASFLRVFKQLGARKLPIFINSGGGSVEAALDIGREIRSRKLDVAVVRTIFAACGAGDTACNAAPQPDGALGRPEPVYAICASACPIVLAGGVRRLAANWSHIGLHQIWETKTLLGIQKYYRVTKRIEGGVPVEISRKLVAEKTVSRKTVEESATARDYKPVMAYFKSMGISEGVLALMESTQHTSIRWLTAEEMAATKLTTDVGSGEALLYEPAAASSEVVAAASAEGVAIEGTAVMQDNGRKRLVMKVAFRNVKSAASIDVHLLPSYGSGQIDTSKLTANLALTNGQSFRAANTNTAKPAAPLAASIPVRDFCFARKFGARVFKIGLEVPSVDHARAEAALDMTQSAELAGLLGAVCEGG